LIYYVFVFLSILLTGISQILLKIGAGNGTSILRTYLNVPTISGYISFMAVTIFSVYALQAVQLKTFYALASLNYVIVLALSSVILKEKLSRNKLLSILLIVTGLVVFNL
jgi:small multidrug resistance pump